MMQDGKLARWVVFGMLLTLGCSDAAQAGSSDDATGGATLVGLDLPGAGGAATEGASGDSGGTNVTATGGVVSSDTSPIGVNLIDNGDFSRGSENWNLDFPGDSTDAFANGELCLINESSGDYRSFTLVYPGEDSGQTLSIGIGGDYTFSIRASVYSPYNTPDGDGFDVQQLNLEIANLHASWEIAFEDRLGRDLLTEYSTIPRTFVADIGEFPATLTLDGELYFEGTMCIDEVSLVKN